MDDPALARLLVLVVELVLGRLLDLGLVHLAGCERERALLRELCFALKLPLALAQALAQLLQLPGRLVHGDRAVVATPLQPQ